MARDSKETPGNGVGCHNCLMVAPNLQAYSKHRFDFPDDYECAMGEPHFPDNGKECAEWLASEDMLKRRSTSS